MLILRDNGALQSINQDVSLYLPAFKIKNPFNSTRGITFRQLSSHMSGLPRNPPCPGLFETGCNLSYDKIYQNLAEMEVMYPPGEQPAYSNLGFGLLGRVLEQIKGPTWEQAVQEVIFSPLGMNNSGNSFTKETIKHLALGYYPGGTEAGNSIIDLHVSYSGFPCHPTIILSLWLLVRQEAFDLRGTDRKQTCTQP